MERIIVLVGKRVTVSILLLLTISFISFTILSLAPGNYFDTLRLNPQLSEMTIQRLKQQYHLDQPLLVQYSHWLKSLLTFDFGYSFSQKMPVLKAIRHYSLNTILLALSSLFFTWIVAIPLGIFAAVKKDKIPDYFVSIGSFIGLAVPPFFIALVLLFAVSLLYRTPLGTYVARIIPLGGMRSVDYDTLSSFGKIVDIAKHLVIPTLAVSLGTIASLQRITRGNMLEVLKKQYITTAHAYGISSRKIVYTLAFKNALNPLITILGYHLSGILGGAALVEIICNWPGLGNIMLTAVRSQDIFLVMGGLMVSGFLLLTGNLIADILLRIVDPQIEYGLKDNIV